MAVRIIRTAGECRSAPSTSLRTGPAACPDSRSPRPVTAPTANRPTPRAGTAWPSPPGALRVRPLPRESAASYLTRLAATYRVTAAHLLDGLHITAIGTPGAPLAAELRLSNEAVRRLSAFTRTPSVRW